MCEIYDQPDDKLDEELDRLQANIERNVNADHLLGLKNREARYEMFGELVYQLNLMSILICEKNTSDADYWHRKNLQQYALELIERARKLL